MMPSPRPRPATISNANCCYSDEAAAAVVATPDSELRWSDFRLIFSISGCTAKYDEQAYFLPLALEYLRAHPREGAEYTSDVIYFLSSHAQDLGRDGCLDEAMSAIRECVATWTKTFDVVHFDQEDCQLRGWGLDHEDLVTNGEFVKELIDDLLRFKTHANLAEELVLRWLRTDRGPREAAWFLEYARAEHQGYEAYRRYSGVDMTPTKSDARIRAAITDRQALESALQEVKMKKIIKKTQSPTYWPDLIAQLGLAG